jgi:hypothetical protein
VLDKYGGAAEDALSRLQEKYEKENLACRSDNVRFRELVRMLEDRIWLLEVERWVFGFIGLVIGLVIGAILWKI